MHTARCFLRKSRIKTLNYASRAEVINLVKLSVSSSPRGLDLTSFPKIIGLNSGCYLSFNLNPFLFSLEKLTDQGEHRLNFSTGWELTNRQIRIQHWVPSDYGPMKFKSTHGLCSYKKNIYIFLFFLFPLKWVVVLGYVCYKYYWIQKNKKKHVYGILLTPLVYARVFITWFTCKNNKIRDENVTLWASN